MDDALRLGMIFKTWPFSKPIDALSFAETEYMLARMTGMMPQPAPAPEDAEDEEGPYV